MQVGKDSVVSLTYRVKDEQGNLIDQANEPISYLHGGYDGIFPAIEEALQGKSVGESVSVHLTPEDAFGEIDEALIRQEPRAAFPVEDLQAGMQFEGGAEGSDDTVLYTVTDVTDTTVTVDGNHPLAGRNLDFECTVTGVRPATQEELSHGHVHGEGGHHH